jgi:5-hydroxyisourate hydrolase
MAVLVCDFGDRMARLSTHVLDLAQGKPAEGVTIDLHAVSVGGRSHLKTVKTNADGRTSDPLLSEESMVAGIYELTFHAADYFRTRGVVLTEQPFLDEIVIRFGIADASVNLHVPLLLSPYGYSTYRGS